MNIKDYSEIKLIIPWKICIIYLILLVPSVLPVELFSPILILTGMILLILTGGIIKIDYLKNIWPLLIILFIGIIGMSNHSSRHILRDISYALTPISLLFAGYYFSYSKISLQKILKVIVVIGLIFSLIHLIQFLINPSLLLEKVDIIRQKTFNPGGGIIILSLILGLLQNRLGFDNLFPKFIPRLIGLPLLFSAFIFSFSRIGVVIAITLFLSFLGILTRINWKSILTIGVLAFSFILLILSTPASETGTFRSKVSQSMTEIAVSDYQDMADINQKWRGYETYRALLKFSKEGIAGKILGSGFGSVVDLGVTIQLGDSYLSEIPIFHNGYAYLLVKTGLLGVLCYLIFYIGLLKRAIKFKNSENSEQVLFSHILIGCTLSMMLSMYVVGGIAQIHDSELLLLSGFVVGRLEII